MTDETRWYSRRVALIFEVWAPVSVSAPATQLPDGLSLAAQLEEALEDAWFTPMYGADWFVTNIHVDPDKPEPVARLHIPGIEHLGHRLRVAREEFTRYPSFPPRVQIGNGYHLTINSTLDKIKADRDGADDAELLTFCETCKVIVPGISAEPI